MKRSTRARTLIAAATAAAVSIPIGFCRGGTTWDGGGTNDNWTTPNNWSPNGIPVNNGTAAIVFTGSAGTLPILDIDWDISSLTFNSAAAPFNLGSANGAALTICDQRDILNGACRSTERNAVRRPLGSARGIHFLNIEVGAGSAAGVEPYGKNGAEGIG